MMIEVRGNPAPQGSVAAFAIKKGGAYTGRVGLRSDNPALSAWREAVRAEAQRAAQDRESYGPGEAVVVEMRFYLARPAGHYGTGRNAGTLRPSAPKWPMRARSGDLDKLVRAVLDGLQAGGIVDDDARVIGLGGVWKVWADNHWPGAVIWVREAPPGLPEFTITAPRVSLAIDAGPVVDFATGELLVKGSRP